MGARGFLAGILALAAMLPAYASDRPFPPAAKRGAMTPALYPAIVIDGKTRTLAAGARIWNQDNLSDQPAALRGSGIVVNYTENADVEIDRGWILDRDEAARPPASQQNRQFQ